MRLEEYFFSDNKQDTSDKNVDDRFIVKHKGYFTPSPGRDRHLDLYIELVKNDIVDNLKNKGSLNLSKEGKKAFYELLHHEGIFIRPADKGSGIVVVNKEDYVRGLEKEMEESKSYREMRDCEAGKDLKSVKRLVNKMYREGAISADLKKYLIPRYTGPGRLQGNPKLHKENAPFRTIVNGIGTATEKLAEVAEWELKEFVESSPSYLKDTTDFINKLKEVKEPLGDNCLLFCFDVCKLYPSVPRKEGIDACREALNRKTKPLIDVDNMIAMIETVLDNNVFDLGDKKYIQTDGIAIGSRLGKNFACTYMSKWDEKLLNTEKVPLFYKRFIDDGFGIWRGSKEDLERFAEHANNIHDNIKIELRYSPHQIEFLDTMVKLDKGHIYTDLYVKPTDRQLYLNSKSCHPSSTKKGLAYGLGLRLRRICERTEDYMKHRADLKRTLRRRGYSGKLIEGQLSRVDYLDRSTLLQGREICKPVNDRRVPLVLTYSNLLPNIHQVLKRHSRVLYGSERMMEVFKQPPMAAFRRDRNLADTLVHSKTRHSVGKTTHTCGDSCVHCNIITRTPISDTAGRKSYNTQDNVCCQTANVVYAIKCAQCDVTVYVGETERQLRERMQEHLRDVRLKRDQPINMHFSLGSHTHNDLRFSVLRRMLQASRCERRLHESIWIKRLQTLKPLGCNTHELNVI